MKNPKNVALDKCLESKCSLTPNRSIIFEAIANYKKPVTAYELQNKIMKNGINLNISSIYRVINFWIKRGLIHKIGYLNKYIVCKKPKESHTHVVNICAKCEKILETCNKKMGIDFEEFSSKFGLIFAKNFHLEIPVICRKCNV